jgi:hypothetical protein
MKQLEIIHLRLSGESAETLRDQIRDSIRAAATGTRVVTLYRRKGLETDVAIHINHPEGLGPDAKSCLGVRLASALKAYGLVEHTLWEEMT